MPSELSTTERRNRAVLKLLSPIVQLALDNSMPIQDLIEVSKIALVDAAVEQLKRANEEPTVSRLSVITGMHRRDIKRLLSLRELPGEWDKTLCSRVLGQWEQDSRFRTKNGKPAVLSYDGPDSEFHKLVRAVTRNVNPLTVLKELKAQKAVEETPRGLRFVKRGSIFSQNRYEALLLAARDIQTLLQCVLENTDQELARANLHIRTEYDNIYEVHADDLRKWIMDRGKEFHRSIREHLAKFDKDVTPGLDPGARAGTRVVVQAFGTIEVPSPSRPKPGV